METFVIRVWRAADPETGGPEAWPVPLRGIAEHVGSGARARFGGGEELLRFLCQPAPVVDASGGGATSTEALPAD